MYRDELRADTSSHVGAKCLEERPVSPLPWIQVAPDAPYFMTEEGEAWAPVGQNDAITWPELSGLFRRRDLATAEAYLQLLAAHGVTCIRLMLEYVQVRHRFFERPLGRPVPAMVALWDDLFALCERYGVRILLTPFDTFWMWRRWRWHPYNSENGGVLAHPSRILLCEKSREAIKARLTFAVERWGGSGVLFAWDLWNEIHPGQAEESADGFGEFIHDLSQHVRRLEQRLYGRSHPQTVSLFGPELIWRPHMPLAEPIFRHPDLDFASIHIYEEGTIDFPRDTVAPALAMGKIVRGALGQILDNRPFMDSEHGPIHSFKDHHITLPEVFDDEYFRRMQWAHLAAGGAGGGMRWPNRHPHSLTMGMRKAQQRMATFLPLIDWTCFRRVNLNSEVRCPPGISSCACGDDAQFLGWLLDTQQRTRSLNPAELRIEVPGLRAGRYRFTILDTASGRIEERADIIHDGAAMLPLPIPGFSGECAIALRRLG